MATPERDRICLGRPALLADAGRRRGLLVAPVTVPRLAFTVPAPTTLREAAIELRPISVGGSASTFAIAARASAAA